MENNEGVLRKADDLLALIEQKVWECDSQPRLADAFEALRYHAPEYANQLAGNTFKGGLYRLVIHLRQQIADKLEQCAAIDRIEARQKLWEAISR